MKTFRLFSMAALALAMAACSSEDNALETASPAMPGKLQFTATVEAPGSGATTRTTYTEVTSGDDVGKIKVAWKENDEIAAVVTNSEGKYVKDVLTVSEVNNTDGSATISGDITKPKDGEETVDLIYPADIVTVVDDGNDYRISFKKMSNGTLDGTLESIANNIDYRMADDCALTVSGDKATLTSAAKLESELSIWKLTLQDKVGNALSASKVSIADGAGVMASATLATAGSTAYLPVLAGTGDICISATTADNDYFYMKEGVALAAKKYYQSTVQMTKGAHLAFLSADYEAKDGEILTGTLASNVKISIADGATVTLKDVNINGSGTWTSGNYAGITCEGDATINLEGTNTVKGFSLYNPGIYVPSGKTLTIQGSGSLDAAGKNAAAGIGSGKGSTCGNITINGGTITATGGSNAAGIGGGFQGSCGDITISGGTVNATGGENAAGIGGGDEGTCSSITISGGTVTANGGSYGAGIGGGDEGTCSSITISGGTVTANGGSYGAGIGGGYKNTACGTITITSGVTKVTATKGSGDPNSIGKGVDGVDITVKIDGTVYASGISQSPYEYLTALSLTSPTVGEVIGSDGKNYAAASVPTGVTKVAMIAYVSGSNGLAIALADEGSMNWDPAVSTAAAHTPAFTGGTWKLPTQDEWKNMFKAFGGDNTKYTGLNNALAAAGGDSSKLLVTVDYWSSSVSSGDNAYTVYLYNNGSTDWETFSKGTDRLVRACLAF